ncbi:MAG TPA: UDP-N-acetylmuramoyl-L-alanine--D-glutamate ligase [Gemmatimonadaceae bacterium]|nr:UDP-N-acetylmuramoyl-L-alanine--D-glutamate ligase [Gemmatimonadaceae bacterium]
MIPAEWQGGEIAVIGLGKSGAAAAQLLRREGIDVYASDAGESAAVRTRAESVAATGAAVDVARHDLERIARASLVVVSPGVPPESAPLARARAARVPIVSETEIGLRFLPDTRYVAVTGTNGKTTTTALVGQLLRALGHDAPDAGNIGTPVSEIALRPRHPAWIALEMSSFQLHDTPGVAPAVGVVTNLSPDHLDRYPSVDDYYADKALLFRNASAASRWVLNGDDREALRLHERLPVLPGERRGQRELPGEVFTFSLQHRAAAHFDRAAGTLVVLNAALVPRAALSLFGDHNVANALAAALAVMVADPAHRTEDARARIAEGLRVFRALTHRLEVAGEYDGVLWINDSKATNVSSTLVALEGMTRPTIVLLGGRHKGEPYTSLSEPLRRIGKAVIAYGEAGPLVAGDLTGVVPVEEVRAGASFEEVVARARRLASPGDVVLLSPACSSYDMFDNYEERGAAFKRLAADGA